MSIHQKIYDTRNLPEDEALAIVGGSEIKVRRERLNAFLENNEWDLDAFKAWLPTWNLSQAKPCNERKHNPALPSKAEMAKNVAEAGKQALMSGFKKVSDEEQQRRHAICKNNCEWYREVDDRCAKCGCFTTYKSRLEAWHCPIDKW